MLVVYDMQSQKNSILIMLLQIVMITREQIPDLV